MSVITRFAPSPTGMLHLGGARTALFNWLYARHHGGQFLLRIEDTDKARSTPEAVTAILEGLAWLGITPDAPPVYQQAQAARHCAVVEQLLAEGKAYRCYCTPEELAAMREQALQQGLPAYNRMWRDKLGDPAVPHTVRIKMPLSGETVLDDAVQGVVVVDNRQLDDFVLLRADGTPTYMLSVVVDDHDMGITDIIRGDDHLNNAFRQYHLYQALGWQVPRFAHVPLIHGVDGAKLSKRHGAVGLHEVAEQGILPEAMRNCLLRLGWSYGDAEIISDAEAIAWFGLEGIGKAPARLDYDKLRHINAHYMRALPLEDILARAKPFLQRRYPAATAQQWQWFTHGAPALIERSQTLDELAIMAQIYLADTVPVTAAARAVLVPETATQLAAVVAMLAKCEDWTHDGLFTPFKALAKQTGVKVGALAMPVRIALTGDVAAPSNFDIMPVLGQAETLRRLQALQAQLPHLLG